MPGAGGDSLIKIDRFVLYRASVGKRDDRNAEVVKRRPGRVNLHVLERLLWIGQDATAERVSLFPCGVQGQRETVERTTVLEKGAFHLE